MYMYICEVCMFGVNEAGPVNYCLVLWTQVLYNVYLLKTNKTTSCYMLRYSVILRKVIVFFLFSYFVFYHVIVLYLL